MSLFNIDSILDKADKESCSVSNTNSFETFTYKNTNFLECAINLANDLKREYQKCNINLHKNSINNKKVEYSTFMKESSNLLMKYADKVKELQEKALEQFNHYSKEYNLAELSLVDGDVTNTNCPAKLNCMHNYSLMNIGEEFKYSLPTSDCGVASLRESIQQCKDNNSKFLSDQRASYGNDSFDIMYMDKDSSITQSNFINYLDKSYFDKEVSDVFSYNPETIVTYARRINNDDLASSVNGEFDSVFEDMQIGASAILNMVDSEIQSEAVPYLSSTEEEVKGSRDVYVNLRTSQFIESMCTSIIAAGYKADVLFETLITYRDICNTAENRVAYLKESGIIDHINILIAEATMEG